MTDALDKGIGILDVKAALEKAFQGVKVATPPTMGGSFHAELSFYEYEIRVILTGPRDEARKINFRFQQKVTQPGERKPTKRLITDLNTTDPEELWQAIDDTKAYLLGIVFAITKALRPPNADRTNSVEDLFKPRAQN